MKIKELYILILILFIIFCVEKVHGEITDKGGWKFDTTRISSIKEIDYYDNGNKKVEGYLHHGQKRLRWIYYNRDGSISHDEFYEQDNYGRYNSTGEYKDGKMWNGDFVNYNNGNRVIYNYKDGLLNGKCIFYDEYGFKSMSGMYVNGLEEGSWTSYTLHGNLEFLLFEGKDLHVHDTGVTMFKNGKENGKMTQSHPTSGWKIEEGYYKDGQKDGEWISYYGYDIIKSQGYFKNGQKDGKWTYFIWTGDFSEDKTIEKEEFYENGKLLNEIKY